MRRTLVALLLAGCDFGFDDTSTTAKGGWQPARTGPSNDTRCNAVAHNTPDGLFSQDAYLRCLHGGASPGDAGTHD